jgi:hypothetical protein
MHEGELTPDAGARIGFVQVGLETDVEPVAALPPLLQCFDDALRRLGEVDVSGWQLTARYLPPCAGSAIWDLASGLGWFAAAPGPRAQAVITFESGLLGGQDESEFGVRLQRLAADSFTFGSRVPAPPELAVDTTLGAYPDAPLTPSDWALPATLPEWSASAAAWALATVIDIARTANPATTDFAVRLSRVD